MIKKTLILALVWILAACGPAATQAPTTTPTATSTAVPTTTTVPTATNTPRPTRTATLTPQETLVVMTYNILDGANNGDVDPDSGITDVDRLPRVLEVIKAANPDILGIEEANGWQSNGQATAKAVAKELGMNYALMPAQNGFNVVLYTKFEIRKVYSCCILGNNSNGAMHAEVVTNIGRVLHIFIVHLKYEPDDLNRLMQAMSAYLGQDTILMGDMNFAPYGAYAKQLTIAGWVFPMVMNWGILDQVWTSPFPRRLAATPGRIVFVPCGLLLRLRLLPTPPHDDAVTFGCQDWTSPGSRLSLD